MEGPPFNPLTPLTSGRARKAGPVGFYSARIYTVNTPPCGGIWLIAAVVPGTTTFTLGSRYAAQAFSIPSAGKGHCLSGQKGRWERRGGDLKPYQHILLCLPIPLGIVYAWTQIIPPQQINWNMPPPKFTSSTPKQLCGRQRTAHTVLFHQVDQFHRAPQRVKTQMQFDSVENCWIHLLPCFHYNVKLMGDFLVSFIFWHIALWQLT